MKKVLFCLQTMVLGGVETELITILSRFDKTEYDITLLLLYEQDKSVIEKNAEYKKAIIMIRKPFKLPRDMEHSINKALSP